MVGSALANRHHRATSIALAVVVLLGLTFRVMLARAGSGYPLDDAWIHLDYAHSIVTAGTFGYAPGSWENGSTSPLWSILLAPLLAAGVPAALVGKIAGSLAFVGLATFLFLVGRRAICGLVGVGAAALIAIDPWAAVLSVSGMEPVAAMAAALCAVHFALEDRPAGTGFALALSGLLRPELALLTPLAIMTFLVRGGGRRALAWLVLPPVLAGAAWLAYGYAVTGSPWPNAFRLKVSSAVQLDAQLEALRALCLSAHSSANLTALALMTVGIIKLVRRRLQYILLLVAPPFALILFYVFALPLGGDYGPMAAGSAENVYFARYSLLILPWSLLWASAGLAAVYGAAKQGIQQRSSLPVARVVAALVTLGIALVPALPWQSAWDTRFVAYRANCREIESTQVAVAEWMNANLAANAVIGVSDAGALQFFSHATTIDLMGLNNHELIELTDPVPWLRERGLTHLVVWPHWHVGLLQDPRLTVNPLLVVHVERPTIVAGSELVLFEVDYPDHSAFERIDRSMMPALGLDSTSSCKGIHE